MAVYDTEENGRTEYTQKTLECLQKTVDFRKHRLVIVDNGSCEETKEEISDIKLSYFGIDKQYGYGFGISLGSPTIVTNEKNIGTARAVNQGLKLRQPGEYCIKIDNDVWIHESGWVDKMEEAMEREPGIGVLGLKRKDLQQTPFDPDPDFRSELIQLPHKQGERWVTVERSRDVMGTCTMLNHRMLDVLGGYQDCSVYGYDDTLLNLRSLLSGFWNAFLCGIEIDHLDTGENDYVYEKQRIAGEAWEKYKSMHDGYINGSLDLRVEI